MMDEIAKGNCNISIFFYELFSNEIAKILLSLHTLTISNFFLIYGNVYISHIKNICWNRKRERKSIRKSWGFKLFPNENIKILEHQAQTHSRSIYRNKHIFIKINFFLFSFWLVFLFFLPQYVLFYRYTFSPQGYFLPPVYSNFNIDMYWYLFSSTLDASLSSMSFSRFRLCLFEKFAEEISWSGLKLPIFHQWFTLLFLLLL